MPLLSWTHYRVLLQVNDEKARAWYEKEAVGQTWSVRTLQLNISSQYYYRMLQTQKRKIVESEMKKLTASYQTDKLEFIKNPVVAEFLGLAPNTDFTESDLEKSILSNFTDVPDGTWKRVCVCGTDEDIARFSVMHGNEQLFASKYKLYLPTEAELRAEIEAQKAMFYLQQKEEKGTDGE